MRHPLFTKDRPLRVGTDCSGIEAPIVALRQMGIPFVHEFSSEIDRHCIATIKANFTPRIIFGDMTKRRLRDIPNIDLYVCGFPCQPFSAAGRREGVRDPRGTIFWECVRVIRHKKPMVFVLENVRGLLSIDGGQTFRQMMSELERIRGYHVEWRVLNTADYGIPQSRKRVFIVGILKKHMATRFEWPQPIPCRPLEEFVDWGDRTQGSHITEKMRAYLSELPVDSKFINLSFYDSNKKSGLLSPTITTSGNLWCVPLKRYANVNEHNMLQGFPKDTHHANNSPRVYKRLLGNSISVNVLEHLISSILKMLTE